MAQQLFVISSFSNIIRYITCFYVTFDCFSESFIEKDLFHFFTKQCALSPTWNSIIKKNILLYHVKGGLYGRITMKITILKYMLQ